MYGEEKRDKIKRSEEDWLSCGKGKERRDEIKVTEGERERVKRRRGGKRHNAGRKKETKLKGVRKIGCRVGKGKSDETKLK
jgi:hypothetical protein